MNDLLQRCIKKRDEARARLIAHMDIEISDDASQSAKYAYNQELKKLNHEFAVAKEKVKILEDLDKTDTELGDEPLDNGYKYEEDEFKGILIEAPSEEVGREIKSHNYHNNPYIRDMHRSLEDKILWALEKHGGPLTAKWLANLYLNYMDSSSLSAPIKNLVNEGKIKFVGKMKNPEIKDRTTGKMISIQAKAYDLSHKVGNRYE